MGSLTLDDYEAFHKQQRRSRSDHQSDQSNRDSCSGSEMSPQSPQDAILIIKEDPKVEDRPRGSGRGIDIDSVTNTSPHPPDTILNLQEDPRVAADPGASQGSADTGTNWLMITLLTVVVLAWVGLSIWAAIYLSRKTGAWVASGSVPGKVKSGSGNAEPSGAEPSKPGKDSSKPHENPGKDSKPGKKPGKDSTPGKCLSCLV